MAVCVCVGGVLVESLLGFQGNVSTGQTSSPLPSVVCSNHSHPNTHSVTQSSSIISHRFHRLYPLIAPPSCQERSLSAPAARAVG